MGSQNRVAVIGGGIAGLAGAHYLTKAGNHVTLFEGSDRLGGLGTSFEYRGRSHERFYHVMLPSDRHLLELLDEAGLSDRPYWKESSMGFLYQHRRFRLDRATDLLRFSALPFIDRLRLGFTSLYAASMRSGAHLDDVTASEWLTRLSGTRAFDRFWRPLLEAKFGDAYDRIPALWYWTRFRREKGGRREVKGYPRGGYKALADGLAASLADRGAQIELNAPVTGVDLDSDGRPVVESSGRAESFDQVLSTLPLLQLERVSGAALEQRVREAGGGIEYQGVVNVLVLLRRSLMNHYWMPVVDSGAPFQGVVEATRVIDLSETDGRHLIYLMNYVHRSHDLFRRDPEEIKTEYIGALCRLFRDLTADDVEDAFVFRTPFVEPVYEVGYEKRRPPDELVPGRVYLATTAQVYPGVTSWNGSTELAKRVVSAMTASAGALTEDAVSAIP